MGTPIKTYVCRVKCFFRNRVWTVGETLQPAPGERVPRHFIDRDLYKPDLKSVPPLDPKAFSEWQRKEQLETLQSVGHGKQAPVIPGMPNAASNIETDKDPFQ